jgi:DNA-3-methyladenine glycosylase
VTRELEDEGVLPREFYARPAPCVARALLGTFLEVREGESRRVGRIVETEAYLAESDPASHSFRGPTRRNAVMFGPPGKAYVYFTYGMHHCFNAVTGLEGRGEAVLVRALEPIEGLEAMRERRGVGDERALCSGPAKLVQALGIRPEWNGADLREGPVRILGRHAFPDRTGGQHRLPIAAGPRIGIRHGAELELRFTLRGSRFLSRR